MPDFEFKDNEFYERTAMIKALLSEIELTDQKKLSQAEIIGEGDLVSFEDLMALPVNDPTWIEKGVLIQRSEIFYDKSLLFLMALIEKDESFPIHHHDYNEAYFIVNGIIHDKINRLTFRTGDFFIYPKNKVHSLLAETAAIIFVLGSKEAIQDSFLNLFNNTSND